MAETSNYRDKLIKTFTLLGGLYFFFEFLLPESFLQRTGIASIHEDITLGFIAIGLVTFGLGIINLVMIHGSRVAYARKGWSNSVALLGGLLVMLICSSYDWVVDAKIQKNSEQLAILSEFSRRIVEDSESKTENVPALPFRVEKLKEFGEKTLASELQTYLALFPKLEGPNCDSATKLWDEFAKNLQGARAALLVISEKDGEKFLLEKLTAISALMSELLSQKREMLRIIGDLSPGKKAYNFLFEAFFISLGSAMFSLLGVYIAAAAYRAFRIKTFEATLMMIAALIVILGQIPFGSWIYEGMPNIRNWLLRIPNSAVSRAIGIGASIAGLVIAFRMWFSIESRTFSKRKE